MLVVEPIGRIRREQFVKGNTIKEIATHLGVSRNTVRRIYGRARHRSSTSGRPNRGRSWVDGPLISTICSKATQPSLLAKQLTLIRIFEELRGRGSARCGAPYAGRWSTDRGPAAAYVPLSFAHREPYQFDWSHEVVLLDGVTVIVKAATFGSAIAGCCSGLSTRGDGVPCP
jgi:transposase-like protein